LQRMTREIDKEVKGRLKNAWKIIWLAKIWLAKKENL
jgi:hypothetical protein